MAGWNPDPQGVYPAATGVQFHSGDIPAPQHSPDFGYIQEAIKSVGDYLQQKKSDDIANQILAADTGGATTGATTGDYGGETSGAAPQKSLFDQFAGTSGTPDLGGVEALKMHLLMQHSNAQAAQEQAMANYYNAGGAHSLASHPGMTSTPQTYVKDGVTYVLGPTGWHTVSYGASGLTTPDAQLTQDRTDNNNRKTALKEEFGVGPSAFNKVTYGDFDQTGNFVPNESGGSAMIGNPITTHVKGTPASNGIKGWFASAGTPDQDVPSSYANVFPRADAERGASLAKKYNDSIYRAPQARGNNTGGRGAPFGPPPGTPGQVDGKPAHWDGYGWAPD